MRNDLVRENYNKVAHSYNSNRNPSENDKNLEQFNRMLKPNSTILDIGCGAGKPVDSFFISKGHKVSGIDLSEEMIKLARQNVPKGKYKVQDMSQLQKNEYSVDAVVSFYAIFHTPRETHKDLFLKINSFLPIDGKILVTMGFHDWEGEDHDFYGSSMYWSHFDAKTNRRLIEDAGFTIVIDGHEGEKYNEHQIIIAEKKKNI